MGKRRSLDEITTIVLHCADTPNGRFQSIHDIDLWHGERGFNRDLSIAPNHKPNLKHVGYHYVIYLGGTIESGRPLIECGAHAKGHNRSSIGICLIGRDQFTQEQWIALPKLIAQIQNDVGRKLKVIGHNELDPHKTCPGFDVQEYVQRLYEPSPKHVLMGKLPPKNPNISESPNVQINSQINPKINPKTIKAKEHSMSLLGLLGEVLKPATDLIDSLHTSDEEKLNAKQKIQLVKNQAMQVALEHERSLFEAQSKVITAEAQGQSWLQRSWRPITMLTFLVLIIADTFGLTEFRLSEQAWELLKIGLGGYVIGRSAEKVMPGVLSVLKKR